MGEAFLWQTLLIPGAQDIGSQRGGGAAAVQLRGLLCAGPLGRLSRGTAPSPLGPSQETAQTCPPRPRGSRGLPHPSSEVPVDAPPPPRGSLWMLRPLPGDPHGRSAPLQGVLSEGSALKGYLFAEAHTGFREQWDSPGADGRVCDHPRAPGWAKGAGPELHEPRFSVGKGTAARGGWGWTPTWTWRGGSWKGLRSSLRWLLVAGQSETWEWHWGCYWARGCGQAGSQNSLPRSPALRFLDSCWH